MAKPLTFEFRGAAIDCALEKIDRAKLYGWIETEVQDGSGRRCDLATLASDGHSIVGKGGTALAYLSVDGLWQTKAALKAVDPQGKVITPVPSSFDAPIPLDRTATIDEFLSHNIHLIYRLVPETEQPELLEELAGGTVYHFPFSYRGGLEASAGFLLRGSDGNLFMCVGMPTAIDYVGLTSAAAVLPPEGETVPDDDEGLDFSLV